MPVPQTRRPPQYRLVRTAPPAAAAPVLDADQRRVLHHSGGPLLVLAGPGTGKTTTLVEAVAARVAAGVPVEEMLLLTFSRRAAAELRQRVAARLGHTTRDPIARTLHSYAFGVLRIAAAGADQPPPRLLSAAVQDVLIRGLLAESDPGRWPVGLRPALRTRGFADQLRDLLMRAVERGLDGPALAALGARHQRPDWVAAGEFLTEYHGVTALASPNEYDPAELIRAAHNTLRDDQELLAAERARRRRIFIDEYQDTDPAQVELLGLLAAGAQELVLFGDPDQAIYGFRGTDPAALREVDARYGPTPVLALRQARRGGAALLAASRRVAARLPGPAQQRELRADPALAPGSFAVRVFRTASEEAAYLAGVLRKAHLEGMAWSRMAVLVRSTATTLGSLRRAMLTAGVPITMRGEDLPLAEQPAVRLLLDILGAVLRPQLFTESFAEDLLCGPIGRGDSIYLRRLRRALRATFDGTDGALVATVTDLPGAALLPDQLRRPVQRVAQVLAAASEAAGSGVGVEDALWSVWSASGLAPRWERLSVGESGVVTPAAAAADADLDAVLGLFAAAARFADQRPGAGLTQFLEYLAAQQIPGEQAPVAVGEPDAVSIVTAHASKGLEWDLVCVAHVQEGSWPDLRRRGGLLGTERLLDAVRGIEQPAADVADAVAGQLAEERRLFYVAVTRARHQLVVTAISGEEDQPSRFLDELDPVESAESGGDPAGRPMSRPLSGVHLPGLVAELRAVLCDPVACDDHRAAAAQQLARLADAGVRGADPDEWWGLAAISSDAPAADPARPVPISPSRVESFLTCELRAVLQDFGANDSKIPAAELGTLLHKIAAEAAEGETAAQLAARLDAEWSRLDFGAAWLADNKRVEAGEMLRRLAEWLSSSRAELTLVAVEEPFAVRVGGAELRGTVDRLERDAAGRLVIADYKTGSSRPKPGDLARLPQLGAYQLAIEQGAFGGGQTSGGAMLVQLRAGQQAEQRQGPLAEDEDPGWARQQVDQVASRLRGIQFTATRNSRCYLCDVRDSCPADEHGRQVPT